VYSDPVEWPVFGKQIGALKKWISRKLPFVLSGQLHGQSVLFCIQRGWLIRLLRAQFHEQRLLQLSFAILTAVAVVFDWCRYPLHKHGHP
jgi:hypothetical protein